MYLAVHYLGKSLKQEGNSINFSGMFSSFQGSHLHTSLSCEIHSLVCTGMDLLEFTFQILWQYHQCYLYSLPFGTSRIH